jgi:hypothetical protein
VCPDVRPPASFESEQPERAGDDLGAVHEGEADVVVPRASSRVEQRAQAGDVDERHATEVAD